MDSTDETNEPLTKPKKERTEKQKEAFEKARQKRQEYLEQRKVDEKKQVLKEIKNELNGKTTKRASTSEDDFIDVFQKREEKKQNYPTTESKSKKQICPDSDSDLRYAEKSEDYADDDASTEEEITVIKRKKKKQKEPVKATAQENPKKKKVVKKVIYETDSEAETSPDEDKEEEEPPKPTTRPTKSQQNRNTKNQGENPKQNIPRYYFGN